MGRYTDKPHGDEPSINLTFLGDLNICITTFEHCKIMLDPPDEKNEVQG